MSTAHDNRFYRESVEHNPLQIALDNYHMMEAQRDAATARGNELATLNGSLTAEVNMLREALNKADEDRLRLQAISSTLLGRLLAINDTIAGAVKAAVKDGIEAVAAGKAEDELERAIADAPEPPQRADPVRATETATHPSAAVGAPLSPLRILGSTPLPAPAGLMRPHLR